MFSSLPTAAFAGTLRAKNRSRRKSFAQQVCQRVRITMKFTYIGSALTHQLHRQSKRACRIGFVIEE